MSARRPSRSLLLCSSHRGSSTSVYDTLPSDHTLDDMTAQRSAPLAPTLPRAAAAARRRAAARAARVLARARPRSGRACPQPAAVRHRSRRRRDDGEPVVRSFPRLAAGRGRQAGGARRTSTRRACRTRPIRSPRLPGLRLTDPDHSYEGGARRVQRRRVRRLAARRRERRVLDRLLHAQRDLPFLGQAAPAWTTCDRYFAAIMARRIPNRFYLHAAQTDRHRQRARRSSTLPTIWDRLAAAGLTARYYFSDVSVPRALGREVPLDHAHRIADVLRRLRGRDAARGLVRRPALPSATRPGHGRNDDHPHADIRAGECFLYRDLSTRSRRARPGRARCSSSPSTSGAASSTTCRRRRRARRRPDAYAASAASASRASLISPFARRGARRARRLRPHLDPQADRVALGSRSRSPSRDAAARNLAAALDFSHRMLSRSERSPCRASSGRALPRLDARLSVDDDRRAGRRRREQSRPARRSAARMHPFETACPIDHGSFVPWIAIGPPCAQPVSTGENAEIPTAPGPNGPLGSVGTSRWFT